MNENTYTGYTANSAPNKSAGSIVVHSSDKTLDLRFWNLETLMIV